MLKGSKPPFAVPVDDTATELLPFGSRAGVIIANKSDSTVYLGSDDSVTTENGIPLAAGDLLNLEPKGPMSWWAVAESGQADVRVMEFIINA